MFSMFFSLVALRLGVKFRVVELASSLGSAGAPSDIGTRMASTRVLSRWIS